MEKMIYPFLIEEREIRNYYEQLLDNKYELKIFEKKKNNEVYNFFLPDIRNQLFWTFSLTLSTLDGVNKSEFNKMTNELKAVICANYYCNVFEKKDTKVICFNNGICFAISSSDKEINKIKKYQENISLEEINLRDDIAYKIMNREENNEPFLYLYVIQLYKMILLHKIHKQIQNESQFNKARNEFVKFVEEIYNTRITDDKQANKQCEIWNKEFELDKLYIKIDDEFDLLYKNSKLNENNKLKMICITIGLSAIIVGLINLWVIVK